MKLSVKKRTTGKSSDARCVRREGNIPAVIYANGKTGDNIAVNGDDFAAAMRSMSRGHLPNTIFILKDDDGKECKAIVKEIQYHRTTYKVLHLDFQRLEENITVNVKVPIEFIGAAECVGVKLGGVIRQVIRHLPVCCLPKDIPDAFNMDVSNLNLGQSLRMKKIAFPKDVLPLVALNEVAVVIAKR